MRSFSVSTDVFARIWSLRQPGEDTEDAILRRVLNCSPLEAGANPLSASRPRLGFHDTRYGVSFAEGFELFRSYLGTEYRASAVDRRWLLHSDGRTYGSINELSRAIGARTENAWINWFFVDDTGRRRPVSDLRDPSSITSRKRPTEQEMEAAADSADQSAADEVKSDGTWRDDVRAALAKLGGRAPLRRIYREVEVIRTAARRSVPPSIEATVRRTLEDHSSDSENHRGGLDIFWMPEGKGAGIWALR